MNETGRLTEEKIERVNRKVSERAPREAVEAKKGQLVKFS